MKSKHTIHHSWLKKTLLGMALGVLLAGSPQTLRAEDDIYGKINVNTGVIGTGGADSTKEKGIPFLNRLINFSSAITVITLLVVIIVNGIKVINNDQGAEALKKATVNILISILGLGLTASAAIIVGFLGYTFYGDTTFYTDPVSHMSGNQAFGNPQATFNSYYSLISLLTGGSWFDQFSGYAPTSPNQVFGTPAPVATAGIVAQSYTSAPQTILASCIGLLAGAASIWLLIAIIWNGYKIITSSGSPDVLNKALKTIGYSIIGFLIAVMAYLFTSYLSNRLFNNRNYLDNTHSPVNELLRNSS